MFSRGEIKVSDIPASLIEIPLVADVRGQDKMQDRIWLSPTLIMISLVRLKHQEPAHITEYNRSPDNYEGGGDSESIVDIRKESCELGLILNKRKN